jgi:copper(I)-binding protein
VAVIRSTSRSRLAGLVVVGGLALAGCGAGQVAQTAQQQSTTDGVNAQAGDIAIRNAALDYPNDGAYAKGDNARLRMVVVNQGTEADTLLSVSSTAADGVTITDGSSAATGSATPEPSESASASAGPSASDSAGPSDTASSSDTASATPSDTPSGTDTASATPSPTPSQSPTRADAQVQIPPDGYVSFTDDGPDVELTGLTSKLLPAQNLQVTLVFANAGPVTMTIAVATPESGIPPAPTVSVDPDSESEG